jgi:formylglycine-generating enzyme
MKNELLCFFLAVAVVMASCNNEKKGSLESAEIKSDSSHSCMQVPTRFGKDSSTGSIAFSGDTSVTGMSYIPGGIFDMGGDNEQADPDELPKHKVQVSAFYMDVTEVTNAQFKKFVDATGYITTAEKKPDWEEMKKTVPPGTPKPSEDMLQAASLVFMQANGPVDLNDYSQWWKWEKGADWKHPQGSNSSIIGKENYPVVQVSWDDAMAYCKWTGKRLPTEAEWEFAARGGLLNNIYPWGNEHINTGKPKANSWEGKFPYLNEKKDGYITASPIKSFPANGYGLHDMAGNVWEWCSDLYNNEYYKQIAAKVSVNPQGANKSFDPQEPYTEKRSLRGGSFLCNDSYCSGYRVARRMKSSHDTGLEHTGFRCVRDVK